MIDDMCEYTKIRFVGGECKHCGAKDSYYIFMPEVDTAPPEAQRYISGIELCSNCMRANVVGKSPMKELVMPVYNKPETTAPTNQNLIKALETITEAVRKNGNRRQ